MPFSFFIDGMTLDKFHRITMEPVLGCCNWFKKEVRNRQESWFVQGFVPDRKQIRNKNKVSAAEKMKDYHTIIAAIFAELKEMYESGGIRMTLDFGNGKKHDVIGIPVVQFIIGDAKGNDVLCLRKPCYTKQVKMLCRDCTISPHDASKVTVDEPLICDFITKDFVTSKSKEELESETSFYFIDNFFNELSFGQCERGIYGNTPVEMLHSVLLGICDYIGDCIDMIFNDSTMDILSNTIIGIYNASKHQSERSLPSLHPFRDGLGLRTLKGKERYSRVFAFFLALMNSYTVEELCKRSFKGEAGEQKPKFTANWLRGFTNVLEETLIFFHWLNSDEFLKSDFEAKENEGGEYEDCRAMRRIKLYLISFKEFITRGGCGLDTSKYHQMLHIIDIIVRHGRPSNYDGGRGEAMGKEMIKENGKLTNKQRGTIDFDIATRIVEENIIHLASVIHEKTHGIWPSKYGGKKKDKKKASPKVLNNDNVFVDIDGVTCYVPKRPRFYIDVNFDETNNMHVKVDWGSISSTPNASFDDCIVASVVNRLYIGWDYLVGTVHRKDKIPGFTHIEKNNVVYRAHPCYGKGGRWFDWAYFKWDNFDDPVPARILMIIDLRNVTLENNDATIHGEAQYLTNDIWCIVHSAKGKGEDDALKDILSDNHFDSRILKRIMLGNNDEIWMLPLKKLVGPCFVIRNQKYCGSTDFDRSSDLVGDNTAVVVDPITVWGPCFLPPPPVD